MPRETPRSLAAELEAALRAHGDAQRAVGEKAYLKSDLEFAGVSVPVIRSVVREFLRAHTLDRPLLVGLVCELWAQPLHERRTASLVLLDRHAKLLASEDIEWLEDLIRRSLSWAYVDELAIRVVGGLVERDPALLATLDRWAQDGDFWVRRSGLLALLGPLRRNDVSRFDGYWARFTRYADTMLEEREFFIRKAIGWVLRETSKRRPEVVAAWLRPRAARTSGVTLREAVKYLDEPDRLELMALYAAGTKKGR